MFTFAPECSNCPAYAAVHADVIGVLTVIEQQKYLEKRHFEHLSSAEAEQPFARRSASRRRTVFDDFKQSPGSVAICFSTHAAAEFSTM